MPELSEKEYERLEAKANLASFQAQSLFAAATNLGSDLRLAHQNDPAHYHETIQTTPRCMFCGHEGKR